MLGKPNSGAVRKRPEWEEALIIWPAAGVITKRLVQPLASPAIASGPERARRTGRPFVVDAKAGPLRGFESCQSDRRMIDRKRRDEERPGKRHACGASNKELAV